MQVEFGSQIRFGTSCLVNYKLLNICEVEDMVYFLILNRAADPRKYQLRKVSV
jgi:hypothetical protein